MGLGDFFRRLRGDRRAMPDPDSPEFQAAVHGSAQVPGTNVPGTPEPGSPAPGMPGTPAPGIEGGATSFGTGGQPGALTPEALIAAGVPPDHAQRAVAAVARLQQGTHTLDVEGMQGMRDEMREVMRRHGVDPDSGMAMDASSVPGLQEALLGVLARHGVDLSGQ